jgi:hypothetical protein
MSDEPLKPDSGPRPGVLGLHTGRAVDHLKKGDVGDTVSRADMADIVGRDCMPHSLGYGNVNSAIRHVERVYGLVWRWMRDEQKWRCLNDDQRLESADHGLKRHRRGIKRELHVTATIDPNNLSDDRRRDFELTQAAAGAALLCASGGFRKRLKAIGNARLQEPDATKLIDLMKR